MLVTKKQYDLLYSKVNNLQSQITELTSQVNEVKDNLNKVITNIDITNNKVNVVYKKISATTTLAEKLFPKSLPSTLSNKEKQSSSKAVKGSSIDSMQTRLKSEINCLKIGQVKRFKVYSPQYVNRNKKGFTHTTLVNSCLCKIPGMTFRSKSICNGKPGNKQNSTHVDIKRIK